jgi:Holliday junction resolvasome RuvABC endonuclease subunit
VRVVGLDLSLTGSGVAVISSAATEAQTRAGERYPYVTVQEYGSKAATPDLTARGARLRSVAAPVIRACQGSDLVMIEDLYMGSGTGGQLDRAGLWWIIVNSLTAAGTCVVPVTNNHLKMFVLGRGGGKGTDKDYVLAAIVRRYPSVPVQSNNTADALALACIGARRLGHPIETDLPETHLRALTAIHWPPGI